MDTVERFQICLRREGEPDRVPSFCQELMSVFSKNFLSKYQNYIKEEHQIKTPIPDFTIRKFLGFDSSWIFYIPVGRRQFSEESTKLYKKLNNDIPKEQKEKGFRITREGLRIHSGILNGEPYQYFHEGVLKTEELFRGIYENSFITDPPENAVEVLNEILSVSLEKKFLAIPLTGLLIEPMQQVMSFSAAMKFSRKKPEFFKKALTQLVEINMHKVDIICQSKAPVLVMADDCAFKNGPLFSPKFYIEFIMPHYKKVIDKAHKHDKLVIMHTDGYVEPYYPIFIEAGLDAHESVEPIAGMDLKHLKEAYGDRLTLIGNMDCSRLLPYGTKKEVIDATKKCLKDGAPGGGFIFSPSTDITNSCKVENVMTMMDVYKKYRNYPIKI